MPRKDKQRHPLEIAIDELEAKSKEGMDEVIKTGGQWEDVHHHERDDVAIASTPGLA